MIVHIVSEGLLEAPVARKLIAFCGLQQGTAYGVRGFGNIKRKIKKYEASLVTQESAVLVLTDFMDSKCPCPIVAKQSYLGRSAGSSPHFLLRFAVPELESWLIADYKNFSQLLGVKEEKISVQPDTLIDPKKHIASLARLSRRKMIKEDLMSSSGTQGRLYIEIMTNFITKNWNVTTAMSRSPSLARCVNRLRELNPN